LHRLKAAYLARTHCFEIRMGAGLLVGFVSADSSSLVPLLDNLWVAPEFIGKGIGTVACGHIFKVAREQGWKELSVMPGPPAEGFYARVGFSVTGERVPSRSRSTGFVFPPADQAST
jgi:GNAT superfamily N-acetyltransferase